MDQDNREVTESYLSKPIQVAKYTAKDSLFTDLFRSPKYLFQLDRKSVV